MVRHPLLLAFGFTAWMLGTVACSTSNASPAPAPVAVDASSRVYDVRDLVIPKQPGGKALIELTDLAACLKDSTDGDGWNRPDREIETVDSGYLVVKASDGMQSKVAMVLTDVRRFAAAKQ